MIFSRLKKWRRPGDVPSPSNNPSRNQFKVLPPRELLAPFEGDISAIRSRVSVPPEHWQALYQNVLNNYASLVQRLPSSESHHHSGLGGLLQHGIEVVRHTLDLKQGIILPRGEAPEIQARLQDLWTYACFTAALLHDLGKPVTDQIITLYAAIDGRRSAWSPVHGAMPLGSSYGIDFNPKRVYRHHERIPPLLAHHLIPTEGLQWLAGDQDVLHDWLAAIQGDLTEADAIGEIIGKADGLSVARNLSGSKNVQMPTAKAKPLSERLLTGLRYLLDNGELTMNHRGAAAYLDQDVLWLVSKTTLDKLRTHMTEEGQPGIPTRNDRLMDELQQHGLLVPNEDRAIWLCAITIGDWQKQLTCLRFDADQIWSDPSRRPDSMDGSVEPVEVDQPESPENKTQAKTPVNPSKNSGIAPAPSRDDIGDKSRGTNTLAGGNSFDGLPLPFDVGAEPVDDTIENNKPTPTAALNPAAAEPVANADHPDGQVDGMDASEDAGDRFLAWLKHSIERESVPINTAKARIHVLPEGLALVSPGIFRDFDSSNWSHAQKRFQKLRLHKKTPKDENIWTCRAKGSRKEALLKVILIPNPVVALGVRLPSPNPALTVLDSASTPSVRIDSTV